jgi:hypothetical protein
MNEQFFFDFISIMKSYQKGEFNKKDITETYKLWVNRKHISLEELKELFGTTLFQTFYADMSGSIREIEFELSQTVEELEEDITDKFISTFSHSAIMPKKDLAELSGASETWLHKHKVEFDQSSRGGNVRSYLEWLKTYNIKFYQNFKTNYSK